jgi:ribosomal protein S18 acetylase RimI-like enzyme
VSVERATQATPELLEALQRLLPQLSPGRPVPTTLELKELMAAHGSTLLLARDDVGRVVGTLTLVVFRTTTELRARSEDVVVDEVARGKGIGEQLVREALRLAGERGARSVNLTSRSDRAAANRLYERIGFERRDTNVYAFSLEPSAV